MDRERGMISRMLVVLVVCAVVVMLAGPTEAQELGPVTKTAAYVAPAPGATDGTWNITATATAYTNNTPYSDQSPKTNSTVVVTIRDDDHWIPLTEEWQNMPYTVTPTTITFNPDASTGKEWVEVQCGQGSVRYSQVITFTVTGVADKDAGTTDNSEVDVQFAANIPTVPPAAPGTKPDTKHAGCEVPIGGALTTADWLVAMPGFVEMNNQDGAKGLAIAGISRGWDEIGALLAESHKWARLRVPLLGPRWGPGPVLLYFRVEAGEKLLADFAAGEPAQTEGTGFAIRVGGDLSAADVVGWSEGPTPVTGLNINHADPEGPGDATMWRYFAFAGDPVVYVSATGDPLLAVPFAAVPNLPEVAGLAVEDRGTRGMFEPGDRLLYSDPQSSAIFVLEAGHAPEVLTFGVNTFDGASPLTYFTNDDGGRGTADPGIFVALSVSTRNTASPCIPPDMCFGFCPDTDCPEETHTVSGDTLTVTVWDELSGLCSITQVASGSYNVNVTIPSFTPGTHDHVVVTATKVDPNKSASLMLDLKDCAQNSPCIVDPVMVTLTGEGGVGASEAFSVPSPDHFLCVDNQFARFVLLEINGTNRLVIPLDPTGGLVSFDLEPAFQLGQNTVRAYAPLGQGEKAYLYFFPRPLAD